MKDKSFPEFITDNLFQMSVSCPLKFHHYACRDRSERRAISFRHRNKLLLRDAAVSNQKNICFTSDNVEKALNETREWLRKPEVTICGAVLKVGHCITRIPALVKNGSTYKIIQVHGKLRKRRGANVITTTGVSRTIDTYLLKAAYRMFVLKQAIEHDKIDVEFCFPSKSYRAALDKLYSKVDPDGKTKDDAVQEFDRLFTSVTANDGVSKALQKIPIQLAHKMFEDKSVEQAVNIISAWLRGNKQYKEVQIHEACKYCEFRNKPKSDEPGCWSTFFPKPEILHPDKHVFELIGHGNRYHSENGILYQEQVPLPASSNDFDSIQKQSYHSITIQNRRILQLLAAKEKQVPLIWIKPGLKILQSINYPIHFIDFEAATYAIPFKRGAAPYEQVYFQFSCHTLTEDGKLTHSEWIDIEPDTEYTNLSFAKALLQVDNIFKGTIVQYSPFERQAINNLIREFQVNSMLYGEVANDLKRLRETLPKEKGQRYLDMNKLIRDYYYNCFMEDKLGLKPVLQSILKWERKYGEKHTKEVQLVDSKVAFFSDENPNPYKQIQNGTTHIEDGSEAMDAWISLKNRRMNDDELEKIPSLLKRYCALDSYAMFVIFNHLNKFISLNDEDDYLKFS